MEQRQRFNLAYFIITFLEAMLIGVAGILPGISGGVLCVIFGFYKPLIETLSDPLNKLVPNLKTMIPLALGAASGFLGIARLISSVMEANEALATCVFIGLIIGEIPDLWKESGSVSRTKVSYIVAIVSAVVVFVLLTAISGKEGNVTPNMYWYLFCGAVLGISVIVPGLSSSPILMFVGLYKPMTDAISNFDFGILIFIGIGAVVAVLLLSKIVAFLYKKYHTVMSHFIFGIVVGTTLTLFITQIKKIDSPVDILSYSVCIVIGVAVALAISVICPKILAKLESK